MQKKIVLPIIVLCSLLFLGCVAIASDIPQIMELESFWYYDGYLTKSVPDAGYIVIPKQPVTLYAARDAASPAVGVIPPGQEADIMAISYTARPGQYKLTVKQALSTKDGKRKLKPGEIVGFVSAYGGDAVAVYHNGEIIAVETKGLELSPQTFQYPQAQNQWLYISDRQGLSGWCQFGVGQSGPGERWRINLAHAAGGSANFNPIVFGHRPEITRLTVFLVQNE